MGVEDMAAEDAAAAGGAERTAAGVAATAAVEAAESEDVVAAAAAEEVAAAAVYGLDPSPSADLDLVTTSSGANPRKRESIARVASSQLRIR
jgi:hypothetical protein